MPELPEVETVRRSLEPRLVGRRIERVEVLERRLRYPVDVRALRLGASGRLVEGLGRRAKYLLIYLEGCRCVLLHLGMSGRLLLKQAEAPRERHVAVTFRFDNGLELRFRDHRRFGLVDILDLDALERDRRLRGLGVEPLSRECTARYFHERARGLRRPIKNFLMDARQVVGVGNIYANEALHAAGVHPQRAAGRLSHETWKRLARALKDVLRLAIRRGGTTLTDFQDPAGQAGYYQRHLRVYGREGEPCGECSTPIQRQVLAGRSTFYCARCQR